MKRILFALLALTVLGACKEKNDENQDWMVYDIAPITLSILVKDANNEWLINDDLDSPILQGLKLYYNGECYTLESPENQAEASATTRAYLPHFYPLRIYDHKLIIGEWNGAANYENETAIIEWGDGSTDTFSFSNKVTYNGYHPTISREMYFNGHKLEYSFLTIQK